MSKSPSDVLGVNPNDNEETIKAAYRQRVKETHPDVGGDPEEFQKVKSAYEQMIAGKTNQQQEKRNTRDQPLAFCVHCNSPIRSKQEGIGQESTGNVYCTDCVVTTKCLKCGKGLTVPPDGFADADGQVICDECDRSSSRSTVGEPIAHCTFCESPIRSRDEAIYREKTGQLYCPGCIHETQCRKCRRDLTLTIDDMLEVNGAPVCMSCHQREAAGTNKQGSNGLIPIWAFIAVGAAIAGVFWYYRPTFTVNLPPGTIKAIEAIAGPGLLIVLWVTWRSLR